MLIDIIVLKKSDESLRSDESIAGENQFSYFIPIDNPDVQSQSDPSPGPDVRRQIEFGGKCCHQGLVITGQYFARYRDNSVAMMVVKVVGENLLSDQKTRVVTAQLSNRFRQRQTEFRQAEHSRVFSRSLIHIDFGSFSVKFQRLPARFSTS